MTREEYFKTDAVSRSALVAFVEHPSFFLSKGYEKESRALIFGDAFDCLMFDGKKVLEDRFRFSSIVLPYSDNTNAGKFTDELIRICKENPEQFQKVQANNKIEDDLIGVAMEAADINVKSQEKTLQQFNDANAVQYVIDMIDPMCLKSKESILLNSMRESLLMSRYAHLFQTYPDGTNHIVDNHMEHFHQVVVLFDHPLTGIKLKVMLDIVSVDHSRKRIYKVDLKTTSNANPQYSLFEYRYDIQAGLYSMGIEKWRDDNFPGYDCSTGFEFLFVHKSTPSIEPIKVIMSQNDVDTIISGTPKKYGQYIKNIHTMLSDLKWHMDNDEWSYPKDFILNQGYVAKIYEV